MAGIVFPLDALRYRRDENTETKYLDLEKAVLIQTWSSLLHVKCYSLRRYLIFAVIHYRANLCIYNTFHLRVWVGVLH